jgi:hypothetical protein
VGLRPERRKRTILKGGKEYFVGRSGVEGVGEGEGKRRREKK